MINDILKYFLTYQLITEIAFALLIFMFFLVLRKIFTRYVFKIILKSTARSKLELDSLLIALEKPIQWFFVILGIYASLTYLPLTNAQNLFILGLLRSAIIGLLAWGFYNIVGIGSDLFAEVEKKFDFQVDKILIPFITKIIRFLILFLAFAMIAGDWGFEVGGFLAGLGLGGLAFALAAKDTVANIFGGFVIILDKPFSIGDWIKTNSVEGTVEDISFRSTKVRTFAQALVTVPNAELANQAITNWSRMGRRRITFNLKLALTTPRQKLESCVNSIRRMLENHAEINQQTLFVRFDAFNESSLDVLLYFFTNSTVWGEHLRVKEEVNFKIMEILEQEGVAVAFPRRSIYWENNIPDFQINKGNK